MKKVLVNIKDWFVENKDELIAGLAIGEVFIIGLLILFISMLMAMSNDLVGVVQDSKVEIQTLEEEKNYYKMIYEDIELTNENMVPLQQYIDDIEYLESVIRELRGDTYNNYEGGN